MTKMFKAISFNYNSIVGQGKLTVIDPKRQFIVHDSQDQQPPMDTRSV